MAANNNANSVGTEYAEPYVWIEELNNLSGARPDLYEMFMPLAQSIRDALTISPMELAVKRQHMINIASLLHGDTTEEELNNIVSQLPSAVRDETLAFYNALQGLPQEDREHHKDGIVAFLYQHADSMGAALPAHANAMVPLPAAMPAMPGVPPVNNLPAGPGAGAGAPHAVPRRTRRSRKAKRSRRSRRARRNSRRRA